MESFFNTLAEGLIADNNTQIIAVTGLDCAGKTEFSANLADALKRLGHAPALLHIDDYNNRPLQKDIYRRYKTGIFTEADFEQYYANSIDYQTARTAIQACSNEHPMVIVEGVFLFRKQLANLFTKKIWLHVSPEIAKDRYAIRRQKVGDHRPHTVFSDIWLKAHKRYEREYHPIKNADIVIDNNDWQRPKLLSDQPTSA